MKTMRSNVAKRVLTQPVSWILYHSLGKEQIVKTHRPQSEFIRVLWLKEKKRLLFIIMLYLLWWLHKACFCHAAKHSHRCSDWVRPFKRKFDRPMRCTLYVTMCQASSGPAEHDLMDRSVLLLRDPYITRRYGRYSTPQQPQPPPMTFTFPLFEGLIRAGIKLRPHLLLVFSRSESNLITEDLFY